MSAGPAPRAGPAVLRRVPYFASLPEPELRRLGRRCTVRTVEAGETVFDAGEPCRGLFVIVDGLVEIRQVSFRGREQVFHTEGPGVALGEAPLFDGGGYIGSAVALEPTKLLFLRRAEIIRLCQRRPVVALAMLKTLARRVRRFADLVSDLAFRPVIERVAHHLVSTVTGPLTAGTRVELTLTQRQLAARLGTVRELVARSLAELERAGVVARQRSHITIRDPARLVALARGDVVIDHDGGV